MVVCSIFLYFLPHFVYLVEPVIEESEKTGIIMFTAVYPSLYPLAYSSQALA